MTALLEISGLSKRFGGLVALSNVAMTVDEGEVRGVIGPNGSGKSTMFNLVTGIYPADPGSVVRFRGEDRIISRLEAGPVAVLNLIADRAHAIDVAVLADGETRTLSAPINIVYAPQASTVTITYRNTGGTDVLAPLLLLTSDNAEFRLSDQDAWQTGSISGGSWTVMNQRDYAQPLNSKHASIAQITAAEYNAMVSRWGLPSWSRIKSYNFPDRYWRHSNFVARIDPYPFDPFQDQQWVMVPGLADWPLTFFRVRSQLSTSTLLIAERLC